MPNLNRLLIESFRHGDLTTFEIHRRLCDLFPDQFILATDDYSFDLCTFHEDGKCLIWDLEDLQSLLLAEWRGREKGIFLRFHHVFFEVLWNHHRIKCLQIDCDYERVSFIVAESEAVAKDLFAAVCRYSQDSDGRIIVFNGYFRREPSLEKAVSDTDWEALVLPEATKTLLLQNVEGFFRSKELYSEYALPWKRGVLMYGPPGNGKTHAIKALVNLVKRPCLIIKSLRLRDDLEEKAVAHVFARARQMAPAILVFEDIDTLIQRSNLSSLLNEMDGFANNDGLLCLATTNHLDRLDEALAKRPSRFDRRFEFPNPKKEQRVTFLERRFGMMTSKMKPSDDAIQRVATETKGYSGAMLQELVASCTMSWIKSEGNRAMDDVLLEQSDLLKPKPVAVKA